MVDNERRLPVPQNEFNQVRRRREIAQQAADVVRPTLDSIQAIAEAIATRNLAVSLENATPLFTGSRVRRTRRE